VFQRSDGWGANRVLAAPCAIAAALTLAGCIGGSTGPSAVPPQAAAVAPGPIVTPVPQPPVRTEIPLPALRPEAREAPPPAVQPVAAVAVPRLTSRTLLGMDAQALVQVLGPPDNRRRDPPAQVWQYIDRACILHVFLYPEERVLRVAHVDAVSRSRGAFAAEDCLAAVQRHAATALRRG